MLEVALDHEGVRVGEFDLNVALVDAWELAVQVVGIGHFAHVECWCEGLGCLELGALAILVTLTRLGTLARVGTLAGLGFIRSLVVIEDLEEWREAGLREEGHC